ncbi:GNAT family N-acetyltransferase [Aquimarina sp. W85]|uniref:GNAT family N-acetyltransferase n=1 Tax=Aquimarina rhodophyticola TaxID=3342246 RepID=UPI00366F92A9
MIKKIAQRDKTIAEQIYRVFQVSYTIEAKLLKANIFPPLQRSVANLQNSETLFYGFYKAKTIIAVIEILKDVDSTHVQSLVVDPLHFREGIGRQLMTNILNNYDTPMFTVETGVDNIPACNLYRSLGFFEVKQWDTSFGIRKIRFEKRNG